MSARFKKRTPSHLVKLKVSEIRMDAGTQSRAKIDPATVADYAENMVNGDKFPPVIVFRSNGEFILADGFHRVRACKLGKFETILAEIRHGTRLDALKYSLASNHSHGLRRTNEDKRHAVSIALKEFTAWSDGTIADICGVSQPFVSSLRRQLKTVLSCEKRLGKDGKRRKLPESPASKSEPKPMQVILPNGDDREAHGVVMEIAQKLSGIEQEIKKALARYPQKRGAIRGLIVKIRSDLAFLEKEIAG